jgi:hypothetical protein
MLFVIVEYPDQTFGSSFTAKRPGVTIDSISEPAVGPPDNLRHPALALAQGLSAEDSRMLVTGLAHLYDDLETMHQDVRRGRWMGRFTVRERILRGTAMHRILMFQGRYGTLWTHAQDGIVHCRARVAEPARAEELAEDMRKALAEDGVECQVEVRELGPHDYGTWDELVQASIGLAT